MTRNRTLTLTLGLGLLATLALALPAGLAGQDIPLGGRVVDGAGEPLPGVNVFAPSTYEGDVTDTAGRFRFAASAKPPFVVLVQLIGFRTDSVVITDATPRHDLRFRLRETAASLSEIVVTAGSFTASDTRQTAVLSSVDVATTGATADLAEALSTLPGSTPAGESGQLLVRGGTAEETQAYINGLRVPRLYSSALPDVPSRTRFSPFAFEGITFATGGFSAAYGDALSGALILQTAGLPDKDMTSVGLMTLGGSLGRTQRLGSDQAVAVELSGLHLGAYRAMNPEARERITRVPQGLSANAAYWWEGRGGRNLRVMHQSATQHYGSLDSTQAPFYGASRLGLDNVNTYTQAVLQLPHRITGRWELGAALGTNVDRIAADAYRRRERQHDVQLRGSYAGEYDGVLRYQFGAEAQLRQERLEQHQGEWSAAEGIDRHYAAGFAEADYYLSSKWVARVGLRYDGYDGRAHSLSPRLQLSHLITRDQQVALTAGQYRQRQSAPAVFAQDLGLAPARLEQMGLTYSGSWDGRVLRAEAYAKTYRALLTREASSGALGTAGRGYARGLDLFFRDRATIKDADFWISYSLADVARQRDTLGGPAPVPFASRHNVAVVAKRFFAGPGVGLSATYRWHAGRPYDDPNAVERFGALTPDFHDLSVNVTYITQIRGHFTVLFASLSNVTGVHQVHQYRHSLAPDPVTERYERSEVRPVFPRFPFVGLFVSIGDKDRVGTVDDI